MKTVLAAALIALFALSAPKVVIAADEGEQAGSTTESTTTEEKEGATSSSSTEEGSAEGAEDKPDNDAKSSTMNVHRHRAGACPEGPPCPAGD